MKKLLTLLFTLFILTSYSQENDDIYWTVYDVDTVEEETTTTITNNYYTDYTSRIDRFHRRPYYASYWSYYYPYWNLYYNYGHYSNVSFYWWLNRYWGFGWNYYNYAYWDSYYPTYHYANNHHHPHMRTSNQNKKPVVNRPRQVVHNKPPTSTKYIHIETKVSKRPARWPAKKFNFHPTVPNKTHPDRPKISSPSRVTGPPRKVKMHPSKIQHVKKARK